MSEEKVRVSGENASPAASPILPTVNPMSEKRSVAEKSAGLHASIYVIVWISLSSSVILFNKWILSTRKFHFPILLTAWHLVFATIMTQILARTTTLLDGRKKVAMTGKVYLRAIVPIGVFFSLSLICGNLTYLYLHVSFIQMLKATTPVAVLLATWALGLEAPNLKKLLNVSAIVVGIVLASFGEIDFVLVGFLYQMGGIVFEAVRIVLVERLLSGSKFKMDPLVSLYYYAPVCAVMNLAVALFWEIPNVTMGDIESVGFGILLLNASVAICLNISVVFLIGKTSGLVLTLCGVLKDILLVLASVAIWGTMISGLQILGYTIAIAGMLWFRLGPAKLNEIFVNLSRSWAEFGATKPVARKLVIFALFIFTLLILVGGVGPTYAPGYIPESKVYLDPAKQAIGRGVDSRS